MLAVLISGGLPDFFDLPDQESVKLITAGLLIVCTLLITPYALKAVAPGKPLQGGLHFLYMLLPLLISFSSPGISLTPFDALVPIISSSSAIYTWLYKLAANSAIFFMSGYLFIRTGDPEKTSWKMAILISLLLAVIYVFSLDTGLLQLFI